MCARRPEPAPPGAAQTPARAAYEARGGRRRHARRAAALKARPYDLRHAARGASRPLPVPRGQHAVRRRGQRQRELRLRREALPYARGALRPPGRPPATRGPAGWERPGTWRAPGPGAQAEAHGECARAGPHQQRQYSLHSAAHAHPHGARRPQALQDRDTALGLQLHLAPGQRAAGGRGLRRWATMPLGACILPPSACGKPTASGTTAVTGQRERAAQADLHLLPQQPEKTEQRPGQKDGDSELEMPSQLRGVRWGGRARTAPMDPLCRTFANARLAEARTEGGQVSQAQLEWGWLTDSGSSGRGVSSPSPHPRHLELSFPAGILPWFSSSGSLCALI